MVLRIDPSLWERRAGSRARGWGIGILIKKKQGFPSHNSRGMTSGHRGSDVILDEMYNFTFIFKQ